MSTLRWAVENRRLGELVVSAVFLLVAIVMVVMALDFGSEARRLPLAVGVPFVVMAAANVISQWWVAYRRTGVDARVKGAGNASGEPVAQGLPRLVVMAVVAGLTTSFVLLGLLVTSLAFTAVFIRVAGRHRWSTAISVSIGLTAGLYAFHRFAGVAIYGGLFGPDVI